MVTCLALSFAPAAASGTGERHARADEQATASWVVPTKDPQTLRWFALLVFVSEDPTGGSSSMAVPVKGTCRLDDDEELDSCLGSGRIHRLADGELVMDEQLAAGRIDFTSRNRRYRAALTGTGTGPHIYVQNESCIEPGGEEGKGDGGGLIRGARSNGSFDGKKLRPPDPRYELSLMARGAMVTECDGWGPAILRIDDGRATVAWRSNGS